MKRFDIVVLALVLATLMAFSAGNRANAISRAQDIIRDLNETFKAPSNFPPNPALRPNPDELNGGTTGNNNNGDDAGDERVLVPLGPDEGQAEEQAPEIVPDRTFPFLVALVQDRRPPQEGFVCAGTLIAPRWVVTAAHCTFSWARRWPVDPDPHALFNTTRLSEPGPSVRIKKIIPHPDYDARTLKNDIALVQIDPGAQKFGPPLKLEGPSPTTLRGEIAHIVGWGITNLTVLQRRQREVQQIIQAAVRGESCFAIGNFPELKGSGVFCASSLYRHHDTCYRFGGGPVILRDPQGERYLAGMVAWPAACPPAGDKMNVYLDIQHFVPWIKGTISTNGGPG